MRLLEGLDRLDVDHLATIIAYLERAHLKNFITPHVGRSRNFLSRTINIFTRSAGQGFESASGSRAPSWLSHDIKEVEVVDFRGQIEIRRKALATYNRDELRDQAVRAIARRVGAPQADADRVMELAVREAGRGYDLDPQLPLGAVASLVATRFWEEFRTHTENRHKRLPCGERVLVLTSAAVQPVFASVLGLISPRQLTRKVLAYAVTVVFLALVSAPSLRGETRSTPPDGI